MQNYKAKANKSEYKGKTQFYPVIEFYTKKTGTQSFYLNEPQCTRDKALAVAKKYISNNK